MNAARRLQSAQAESARTAAAAALASARKGIVTDWDPANHAVRVKLQPQGTLTGWLPWKAVSAGNGWGVVSAPGIGAQVEVTFEGGDVQAGSAHGGYFSDVDRPPSVQPGETALVHAGGAFIKLLNDGTVQSSGAWTHTGTLHVTDKVTCDADVVASEVSLVSHLHADVYPGSGESGKPIAS